MTHSLDQTGRPSSHQRCSRTRSGFLTAHAALGALLLATPTLAEVNSARAPSEAAPSSSALGVHFSLDASSPSSNVLLDRLGSDLGVRVEHVTAGESGLFLSVAGDSCHARYVSETGQASERTITLPRDPEQRVTAIALLSDNLVRDEGAALLARLEAEAASGTPGAAGGALQTASAGGVAAGHTAEAPTQATSSSRGAPSDAMSANTEDASGEGANTQASDAEAEPARASADGAHGAQGDPNRKELRLAPVNLTLVSPVSTHPRLFERRAAFALGALYTDIGELEGFGVQGLALRNRGGGRGATVSGIWTHTGGHFDGVRFAGLGDTASGGAHGAQFAGLLATESGGLEGAQFGGIFVGTEKLEGAQFGGIAAVSDEVEGVQFAGVVNASGDVSGAQVGLVNVAGKVHGTQIGLVNIGRGMRGAAIGLININPDIDVSALAWGSVRYVPEGNPQFSSAPMGHVGVRYQTGMAYTLVGVGLGGREGCGDPDACAPEAVFAPGVGGGVRIPITGPLSVDVDGYYQWEFGAMTGDSPGGSLQLRGAAALAVAKAVTLFAGGGPRLDFAYETDEVAGSPAFFAGVQLF